VPSLVEGNLEPLVFALPNEGQFHLPQRITWLNGGCEWTRRDERRPPVFSSDAPGEGLQG
jgi:hypothetical protein